MKKQRRISYCPLILAGILTAGALSMATGTSHARYTTVASSALRLRQEETAVTLTSDVMASGGQTVELGKLNVFDTMELTVNLRSEGGTAEGTLFFTENTYLTGSCDDRIDGTEAAFDVTLTPTEAALELTGERTETVRVYWDDDLWADLRVTLTPEETGQTQAETGTVDGDFLTGMTEFDKNALLALSIAVPGGCDSIALSGLPELTRYSTDGETFTMLYHGGSAELLPGGTEMTVLLDLSAAELDELLTLTAEAFGGGTSLGSGALTARPSVTLMDFEDTDPPLIVGGTALDLGLPTDVGGAELYYTLTRPDGTTENLPVIADVDGSLVIDPVNNGVQAPAGTYLLELSWNYHGETVATRQLTFYINYCSYVQPSSIPAADSTEATTTGGNES